MCHMQNQTLPQSSHSDRHVDGQARRKGSIISKLDFGQSWQQAGGRIKVACKQSITWFLLHYILNLLKWSQIKSCGRNKTLLFLWFSILWLPIWELWTQRPIKHMTNTKGWASSGFGWLAASRRWSIVATSARSSLPALLCAELGYNLRLHCGYLDPTTNNTTTNTTTTTTQARLLSLCSRGRSLGLGLRLGGTAGFQRGQWGLEGGWG